MKTNIDFLSTKFNENTGVDKQIKCEIVARVMIEKLPISQAEFVNVICKRHPEISPSGSFTCVVKTTCKPTDKYDKTVGQRIAETKAQQKVYAKATMIYHAIAGYLQQKAIDMDILCGSCCTAQRQAMKHVEMLDNVQNKF
jgi:hypothetical protein